MCNRCGFEQKIDFTFNFWFTPLPGIRLCNLQGWGSAKKTIYSVRNIIVIRKFPVWYRTIFRICPTSIYLKTNFFYNMFQFFRSLPGPSYTPSTAFMPEISPLYKPLPRPPVDSRLGRCIFFPSKKCLPLSHLCQIFYLDES